MFSVFLPFPSTEMILFNFRWELKPLNTYAHKPHMYAHTDIPIHVYIYMHAAHACIYQMHRTETQLTFCHLME